MFSCAADFFSRRVVGDRATLRRRFFAFRRVDPNVAKPRNIRIGSQRSGKTNNLHI
jgi:hypothetical protein